MYKKIIRLRSLILVYLTHHMALPILKLIRKPEVFPYSRQDLTLFPKGTLGKDLVELIESKQLELLPYYARHDMKHIILGYDTTDEGEVSLQCFMLGNGHVSFPVIATVIYGIVTMPEYWINFLAAFRRGKKTIAISNWNWFEIVHLSTKSLQEKINNNLKN